MRRRWQLWLCWRFGHRIESVEHLTVEQRTAETSSGPFIIVASCKRKHCRMHEAVPADEYAQWWPS